LLILKIIEENFDHKTFTSFTLTNHPHTTQPSISQIFFYYHSQMFANTPTDASFLTVPMNFSSQEDLYSAVMSRATSLNEISPLKLKRATRKNR
jgi:hypothetical protein